MLKKISIVFSIVCLSFFLRLPAFAFTIPVENVFSDIDTSYKYYHELQTLFDKGMIFPDGDGKLNPSKLLPRDEFV
jgi:hypothetical protein